LSLSAKPFSDARFVLRRFRNEVVLAGFAAEAQAPVVMVDKTKLSPTVCAAAFQLDHEAIPSIGVGRATLVTRCRLGRQRLSLRRLISITSTSRTGGELASRWAYDALL